MQRSSMFWTFVFAAVLAAVFAAPTVTSACDLSDGCPDGGFVLECGCVLCLPGYGHTQTGDTSDHGYDCWTCSPTRSAAQAQPNKCKVRPQSPTPHSVYSMLGFDDFRATDLELPAQR